MYLLSLVGIGTGNPQHLTLQAVDALNACDLILIPRKGADKEDLAEARRQICANVLRPEGPQIAEFDLPVRDPDTPDYHDRVKDWHDAIAAVWHREILAGLPNGGRIGFLVWGDPSLYDSTLRIAERLKGQMELRVEVIPGVTSIQALTAGHVIPLNTIGGPVTISTGRQLRDKGWPEGCSTLVIMLDGGCAFQTLADGEFDIWWSAYAGMPQEIRLSGALDQISDEILKTRAEARTRNGWIMDIYLLRRRGPR
ncbi:precorrin-6A synthase (deacetylating) [Roseovarius sp. 2305UL8-3]|uniref:precorrin-6A synthase (deacetylating) n=1 Tax=Roseovarius conchicola TaxID=3121636 RepID=UPI003529282E